MDNSTANDKLAVISFASQIGESKQAGAEAVAQDRGWLDADGEVTADGQALLASLDGQGGTRSVFRQY